MQIRANKRYLSRHTGAYVQGRTVVGQRRSSCRGLYPSVRWVLTIRMDTGYNHAGMTELQDEYSAHHYNCMLSGNAQPTLLQLYLLFCFFRAVYYAPPALRPSGRTSVRSKCSRYFSVSFAAEFF